MMKRVPLGDMELNVRVSGQGPPLLLVHGFPLDHTMWREQIEELSSGFQVIAPDLRGFGKSDVTPGKVTMEQMADDLARLLEVLHVDRPVSFCGLSMGGYVAWQFWLRHADLLDRLVLCDTRAVADTEEMARFRLETADRVLREGPAPVVENMMGKLFSEETVAHRQDLLEQTRQVMVGTDPEGIAAALRGMAEREDMRDRLGDIRVPTLLICGQFDVISLPEEMEQIAAAMIHADFVEVAAAGHMAPLENPTAVNTAIREFLPFV
jgi:pimeloyl-ACP methyl ester carboxylesterase